MAERISARPSPTPALSRRRRPSGDRQQIDLFPDVPPISPIQMPVWQELPKECPATSGSDPRIASR